MKILNTIQSLFKNNLEQMPYDKWNYLSKMTLGLQISAFLVILNSFLSAVCYLNENLFYTFLFAFFNIIALSFFIFLRKKTDAFYHEFLEETKQRHEQKQPISLLTSQRKTIKKAMNYSTKRMSFFLMIIVLFTFSTQYIWKEIKKRMIEKPETIVKARKKASEKTKIFLQKIKENLKNTEKKLVEVDIQQKVIEKTLLEAKNSLQQQQGNFYQMYDVWQMLYQIQNNMQQKIDVTSKEDIIKQNPLAFSQVLGMKQIKLDILEKETSQATAQLNGEGQTIKEFNDLLSYQQRCQYKAQKSLEIDQKSIQKLQKELTQIIQIKQELKAIYQQDSLILAKNK
jgi:hypothetical protein